MRVFYINPFILRISSGLLRKNTTKTILTFLLASLLATLVSSTVSMGGGNTIIIQKADAVQSFDFDWTTIITCNEVNSGANNAVCQNDFDAVLPIASQTPATGSSNIANAFATIDQLTDCDESGSGDNNVFCNNDDDWLIGPVIQTNNPSVNPVGSNVIGAVVDNDEINNCDESGSGNNDANCENLVDTEISSATQSNTATGPATIAFDQDNAISTHQRSDVRNTCGEIDGGINDAKCFNTIDNIIGPLDQSNTATGTGTESFDQVNNFGAAQHAAAENDCDESGMGIIWPFVLTA